MLWGGMARGPRAGLPHSPPFCGVRRPLLHSALGCDQLAPQKGLQLSRSQVRETAVDTGPATGCVAAWGAEPLGANVQADWGKAGARRGSRLARGVVTPWGQRWTGPRPCLSQAFPSGTSEPCSLLGLPTLLQKGGPPRSVQAGQEASLWPPVDTPLPCPRSMPERPSTQGGLLMLASLRVFWKLPA